MREKIYKSSKEKLEIHPIKKIDYVKDDYRDREYLSSIEVAKYLDITVKQLHQLVNSREIPCIISASGQMRFNLKEIEKCKNKISPKKE